MGLASHQCPHWGTPPSQRKQPGIETAEVPQRPLVIDVRALGFVAVDERKLSRIVVRAAGYVEELYVNESFAVVRKGEPLAEIYSPELCPAARELLIARDSANAQLVGGAREKLELLGVAEPEIDEILRSAGTRHTDLPGAGSASSRLVTG